LHLFSYITKERYSGKLTTNIYLNIEDERFNKVKKIQKEIIIIIIIFIILALSMHFSAWIDHPVEHIKKIPNSILGIWHPLVFTIGVYLLIWIIRFFIQTWKKIKV